MVKPHHVHACLLAIVLGVFAGLTCGAFAGDYPAAFKYWFEALNDYEWTFLHKCEEHAYAYWLREPYNPYNLTMGLNGDHYGWPSVRARSLGEWREYDLLVAFINWYDSLARGPGDLYRAFRIWLAQSSDSDDGMWGPFGYSRDPFASKVCGPTNDDYYEVPYRFTRQDWEALGGRLDELRADMESERFEASLCPSSTGLCGDFVLLLEGFSVHPTEEYYMFLTSGPLEFTLTAKYTLAANSSVWVMVWFGTEKESWYIALTTDGDSAGPVVSQRLESGTSPRTGKLTLRGFIDTDAIATRYAGDHVCAFAVIGRGKEVGVGTISDLCALGVRYFVPSVRRWRLGTSALPLLRRYPRRRSTSPSPIVVTWAVLPVTASRA